MPLRHYEHDNVRRWYLQVRWLLRTRKWFDDMRLVPLSPALCSGKRFELPGELLCGSSQRTLARRLPWRGFGYTERGFVFGVCHRKWNRRDGHSTFILPSR